MPNCPRCGGMMQFHDETTRVREFACAACHTKETEWKSARLSVGL